MTCLAEQNVEELLEQCGTLHGHVCPGQLLGVRMAILGCKMIGIEDPKGADRKKLIVWIEIDRCMTDAISAVTGVRLGRRSMKFVDYGKVAATFLNTQTSEAVRLVARDDSRGLADKRYPQVVEKKERQLLAYKEASDDELFNIERVSVQLGEFDSPGHAKKRITCANCGEGINDGKEILARDGKSFCKPCSSRGYYKPIHKNEVLI